MIAEVDVFGVLVSSLLLSALIAWAGLIPLRRMLAWLGFYRWTWHRPLADVAVYVVLWGAATAALPVLVHSLP